jgi:hypothetical protein
VAPKIIESDTAWRAEEQSLRRASAETAAAARHEVCQICIICDIACLFLLRGLRNKFPYDIHRVLIQEFGFSRSRGDTRMKGGHLMDAVPKLQGGAFVAVIKLVAESPCSEKCTAHPTAHKIHRYCVFPRGNVVTLRLIQLWPYCSSAVGCRRWFQGQRRFVLC